MTMSTPQSSHARLFEAAMFLIVAASLAAAQTRIEAPKNKYTPAQDVELGQQAAKEVEQQLPLLRDDGIDSFVDRIGRRLMQVTPPEMQHSEFRYSFRVVNVREINAFALPGGPMYVNRGMIQAATVEGEVAGVILRSMSAAPTTEEVTRKGKQAPTRSGQPDEPDARNIGARVAPPSSRYKTYTEGNLFRVSVPDNWKELATSLSVKFVPDGASGQVQGRPVFTHGVELGFTRNEIHSLGEATQEFIDGLSQSNPSLRATGGLQNTKLSGRNGLMATFTNVSERTGRGETVEIFTTLLRDNNLFYCIAVAPQGEYQAYQPSFQRVAQSIRLTD